jgi:hypothetical protein
MKGNNEMADSYTLFSETIARLTYDERVWIHRELQEPEEDAEDFQNEMNAKYELGGDIWPGFDWTLLGDDDSVLSIYSEDHGNVENVAKFMQQFIQMFRPNESFTMEFAFTCSKNRSGEFGGGCVFVTADKIEWLNTGEWMAEKMAEFKSKTLKLKAHFTVRYALNGESTDMMLRLLRQALKDLVKDDQECSWKRLTGTSDAEVSEYTLDIEVKE